jgi:hypothetical protein
MSSCKYSTEVAHEICARISIGDSLDTICKTEGMPAKLTVFRWIEAHSDFAEQYDRARRHQAECIVDEIIDLADSATSETWQVVKLQIHARQWHASKLAPKKYGDRQQLDVDVKSSYAAMSDAELEREMRALIAKPVVQIEGSASHMLPNGGANAGTDE